MWQPGVASLPTGALDRRSSMALISAICGPDTARIEVRWSKIRQISIRSQGIAAFHRRRMLIPVVARSFDYRKPNRKEPLPMMNQSTAACLKYWDLSSTLSLDAAVALWCGVEPGELASLGYVTHCMEAKREALIDALREHRLDYEDRPVPRSDGRGSWYGAGLQELIDKGGVRIRKDSLRRWFEELPIADRPAFLFDEARQELLPDGGEVAEMNTLRALAIMAWLLAESKPVYQIAGRPNASEIGKAVDALAEQQFPDDKRGFKALHKKLSKALKLLEEESQAKPPWARN
jgi:hypothetical protein